MKQENELLKNTVKNQGGQIEFLQREIRRKNLIAKGIRDDENEKSQKTREKNGTVLQNIEAHTDTARNVDEIRRIGKCNNTRTRPIIVKLTTDQKKQEIMERAKKLKGTNIWMEEDYMPRTIKKRKKLVSFLKNTRQRGERTILKYDKIILWEQLYGAHELEIWRPHREIIEQRNTQTPKRTLDMRSPMGESLQDQLRKITRTTRKKN
ncbi:hypothetical protein ILUMI_03107 [Ignelater luminosus]|uniref:Uncharacterized protein n=1 Tax=Ignelater luminosus TaxID=2038154 RepID=A0A8K0GMH9_IGNLU|nr:hypothetical protein ILUMI_03107 [Ignelater luminosus]